jgi:hypothetical protein
MLPEIGSAQRDQLEAEALDVGLCALQSQRDRIPEALYSVYSHFRMKFIEERGLMDSAPGVGAVWEGALADARRLEAHVSECWARTIDKATE